jgi:26S proteasome regulatory subunit N6
VQSAIDLMSGILHAEEKDYKTGYSYFFESFEQQHALGDAGAVRALKYMLLCKVMLNSPEEVAPLVASKGGLAYAGPDLDAMSAVAAASAARSLAQLQDALQRYAPQLGADPIVAAHLEQLYETLLERNLGRIIEPFSRVEIAHVANLVALPAEQVERKLSQMILDKKFAGTLDQVREQMRLRLRRWARLTMRLAAFLQGNGFLVVFEESPADATYTAALETIANLERVVDALAAKSAKVAG